MLIASDQILISIIDAVVFIILLSLSLAIAVTEVENGFIIAIGVILTIMSGLYPLLKNVLFRRLGCILKKAVYVHDENKGNHLWIKVLLHNIVSVSPLISFSLFPLNGVFLVFLIYLLNFVGYKTDNRRLIDKLLKISVVDKDIRYAISQEKRTGL